MTNATQNATQKKRTWAGYACPVCRFVFRVPRDHEGVGVICPACRYLLNIPQQQQRAQVAAMEVEGPRPLPSEPRDKIENLPIVSRPLAAADLLTNTASDNDSEDEVFSPAAPARSKGKRKRVRRKKQQSPEATPSWESQTSSSAGEGSSLPWIIGGSLLGLAVLGVGAWLVLSTPDPSEKTSSDTPSHLESWDAFKAPGTDFEMTSEEKKTQQEIEESVNTGMDVMAESEKVVRAFLTAKTSAELEKLVRTPDVTIPRMRKWYATHEWAAPGAKTIGYGGGITVKGVMASMSVQVDDYSIQHIAVERTSNGYLIDWESWVAWMEMDWEDLFKKRPTELVAIRVICSSSSYYNRLFSDDTKWMAVRMDYPNADRAIYGYIDGKVSTLTGLIGDLKSGRPVPVTIKIRFPKDSVADNQVFIEEYVQNGWVRPAKSDQQPAPSQDDSPIPNE